MSGEIAEAERCVRPATCPISTSERRAELRELDAKLDASKTLESYNQALRYAEDYLSLKGSSYLIRYDLETHGVTVKPFSKFQLASGQYLNADMFDAESNTVLVEVDRVEDLREAYPNYFLDVTVFTHVLRNAVSASYRDLGSPGAPASSKWASVIRWTFGGR